jgi:ATP-dependent Clp protease ATP-binding subunit ClpA
MTLEALMDRELKVYFHTDRKLTRRKQPAKFHAFPIRQTIIALQDLMKNKKDFAQLQQQIPHDATKKPGRISGLFSLKDQKDLLSE